MIQQDDLIYVTGAEIDAARTPFGGWTRRQLAQWGVAWPPQKGWRIALQNGRRPDKGTEKLPPPERKRHADDQQREKDGGKLKKRATEEHARDVCKVCGKPASITITQGMKRNGALNIMWVCSHACADTVPWQPAADANTSCHRRSAGCQRQADPGYRARFTAIVRRAFS